MPKISKQRKPKAIRSNRKSARQKQLGLEEYVQPPVWWKQLDISPKLVALLPSSHLCVFCRCSDDCEDKYGEFLYHSFSGLRMHYFCLLLASGLQQSDENKVADSIEVGSIYGFLIKDIIQEVKRASRLRCVYCYKFGASIGCVVAKCKTKVHFCCGLDNGLLSQFYKNFKSYCPRHRPHQTLKGDIKRTDTFIGTASTTKTPTQTCPICLESVACSVDDFRSLCTPCCSYVWLHRSCVQQQAYSSGIHFFRCPICNDTDTFAEEMQRMGIYVPERDASWELAHDAYHELLQRHSQCDRPHCRCPHGRDYNLPDSEWAVLLCDLCGSSGTHIACDDSVENETSYHACQTCVEIHTVDGARELAAQMGVIVKPRTPPRRSNRIGRRRECSKNPTVRITNCDLVGGSGSVVNLQTP